MKIIFAEEGPEKKEEVTALLQNFDSRGELLNDGARNSIKLFQVGEGKLNVKSFKVPNAINKVAYRFFRKSKAERSFNYAQLLLAKNIGTPRPVAYAEETSAVTFGRSFYVSEHLDYDLTYRELVKEPDLPRHEEILRAFTRFTFELHEKGIEFLDHSPGNTLIRVNNRNWDFFLVDLNRMNFRDLDFEERMKNFSRLTSKKEMVEVMADEYAALSKKPKAEVFEKMWFYTSRFQKKFRRKHALKKKLRFWKS